MSGPRQPEFGARLRAYLSAPELTNLWDAARSRLERNGLQVTATIVLDLDDAAAEKLSGLLGRGILTGPDRKLKLSELDAALRRSAAGQGLISVLERLDGRPLLDRAALRRDVQAQWAQVWRDLDTKLAGSDLAHATWIPEWIAGLRRTGILTRAGQDAAARALTHAVAGLAAIAETSAPGLRDAGADTGRQSEVIHWELGELATRVTGDAHGLDDSQLSSALLLRAAALALREAQPESAQDRRRLWHALGVATDSISGTVITWRLRPPGADRWSAMMRERADLGLVTHLTLQELAQLGSVALAQPGQVISVCENPQVLQAAAHVGSDRPLVCLSGNPATAGTQLLRAFVAGGLSVRYHGDFDWPGMAIATRVLAEGATPWRLSADDYLKAVARLDGDHALTLSGKPVPTPWDPCLATRMSDKGLAVHEESLLSELVADL